MKETERDLQVKESSTVESCNHCTSTKIDGETVLLDLEDGIYYRMNSTGSYIWEKVRNPTPISEITDDAMDEFELSREKCSQYVTRFLLRLKEKGLISFS
jgi:hypothetical protein